MWSLMITLPRIVSGGGKEIFGIFLSAYFSGMIAEDFFWYVANLAVKLKEFYFLFSEYYPLIKMNKRKIVTWVMGWVLRQRWLPGIFCGCKSAYYSVAIRVCFSINFAFSSCFIIRIAEPFTSFKSRDISIS